MSQHTRLTDDFPVTLFHFPDAICAQKVRLALEEKEVPWKSKIVNGNDLRSPEFLAVNPLGYVPVLIHSDFKAVESRIISEYIEDTFTGRALLPQDSQDRYRVRFWTKQIDDYLHLSIFSLSFVLFMRQKYLRLPEEALATSLPGLKNPVKRMYCTSLLKHGFDSPIVAQSVEQFQALAKSANDALSESHWLAGNDYTLADTDLTPYFLRLERLGLSALWRDRPMLSLWISRCRSRESFRAAILDWMVGEDADQAERNRQLGQERFETLLNPQS